MRSLPVDHGWAVKHNQLMRMIIFCGLTLIGLISAGMAEPPARPQGPSQRVPFTTGKVVGYPDPPLPYSAARAFPRLQFKNPLYVIREPGTDRLLVVEQAGKIKVFRDQQQADTTDLFCEINESQTYSLTFHPKYAQNRYVYVFSNSGKDGGVVKNRILRFTVERGGRQLCDPKSETLIIDWPSNGHNGGDLAFGTDGMLYLTSGDGTSDSDGDDTGQNISDLASGILRIDVDRPSPGKLYSVPPDNPFLKLKDARPELWAFGFRNPWRMCFDPATGELLVGDIGQDLWEMIRLVRPGSNHGWSVMEGNHPFQLERRRGPGSLVPPLVEHPHSEARSITGGFVYQGTKFKELQGAYIYGDYSTGKIWAIRHQNGKVTWQREIADTPNEILGFGADSRGELLFVDYGGTLHTLEPSKASTNPADFPRRLSETGLFASVREHRPQPGLLAYTVNAPLWSDGAAKDRFIAIPGLGQIEFTEHGAWRFPEGTVLVKTFSLGEGAERRRIETRLLVFQQREWVGYSYLWNENQTDATLVCAGGQEVSYRFQTGTGPRTQTWRFPSRAECMVCHSRAAGFVLGLNTLQMNREHEHAGVKENQLSLMERQGWFKVDVRDHVRAAERKRSQDLLQARRALELLGVLTPPGMPQPPGALAEVFQRLNERARDEQLGKLDRSPASTTRLPRPASELEALADPYSAGARLTERVRSYLHSNCAHCHVEAGGGNSLLNLHISTSLEAMKIVDVAPQHDRFGLTDARLIAPGHPERSVLLYRMSTVHKGRMPPVATFMPDEQACRLVAEWIRQLGSK